jgi:hypothetical protein
MCQRFEGCSCPDCQASVDPLDEMLHLPIGRTQFMEFTDKVIKYAEVDADHDGQRFALADAIVHLPPGKSMEKLGYFVHLLRKIAVNQTCVMMRTELHAECKRRLAAEEEANKAKEVADAVVS